MNNKNIDCVQLIREIRDGLAWENKNKSLKEFAYSLAKDARKSDLWKKVKITQPVK